MQRTILRTIALGSFALFVGLGAAGQAQAQDVKAPYPNMAPLDQYLLEQNHPGLASKEFETALAHAPGRRGALQGAGRAAKLSGQK